MEGGRITTWFQPVDGGFIVIDGERIHDGIERRDVLWRLRPIGA